MFYFGAAWLYAHADTRSPSYEPGHLSAKTFQDVRMFHSQGADVRLSDQTLLSWKNEPLRVSVLSGRDAAEPHRRGTEDRFHAGKAEMSSVFPAVWKTFTRRGRHRMMNYHPLMCHTEALSLPLLLSQAHTLHLFVFVLKSPYQEKSLYFELKVCKRWKD